MSLPNLKTLGIEKEMDEVFSLLDKSDLVRVMDSCYFDNPHITKRKDNDDNVYVNIEVIDCKCKDWWYRDLIGFQFFCEVKYAHDRNPDGTKSNRIREFVGVKLSKTKKIIFRGFDPSDVTIV